MYESTHLIYVETFSLLNPLLLKKCSLQRLTHYLSLVTLFLLTICNCYLTYRTKKTACIILPYSYALQPK